MALGEQQVAVLGESECIGEMSLLDSLPRSASAVAATDVTLLKITRADFYDVMDERPEVAHGVISVLTRRVRDVYAHRKDRLAERSEDQ